MDERFPSIVHTSRRSYSLEEPCTRALFYEEAKIELHRRAHTAPRTRTPVQLSQLLRTYSHSPLKNISSRANLFFLRPKPCIHPPPTPPTPHLLYSQPPIGPTFCASLSPCNFAPAHRVDLSRCWSRVGTLSPFCRYDYYYYSTTTATATTTIAGVATVTCCLGP